MRLKDTLLEYFKGITMKTLSSINLASLLLLSSGLCNASSYNVAMTGATTSADSFGITLAVISGFTSAPATVTLDCGDFDTISFVLATTVHSLVIEGSATFSSAITFDATGWGTEQRFGCLGQVGICTSIAPDPTPFRAIDLNVSNLSNITWSTSDAKISALPNYDPVTLRDFTASAVPVPAAAWLFGSALVGLFSVGRKAALV